MPVREKKDMPSPQYNPRRQHREPPKKIKRSGASPARRGDGHIEIPVWLWIVIGIAVGVLASFLVRLAQSPATPDSETVAVQSAAQEKPVEKKAKRVAEQKLIEKPVAVATDSAAAQTADDQDAKPDETKTVTKFDFYTLLPEREVIVPNDREAIKAADKPKSATEQQQNAAAIESEQLFLQVGSFRSAQEAERRRAQIRALGLAAKVEEVIANADTWYRVQAGPFTSREQMSKAREQLKAAGIESLLLRQKQG